MSAIHGSRHILEGSNLPAGHALDAKRFARARPVHRGGKVIQAPIHPRDRSTGDGEDFSVLCFQPVAFRLASSPKYPRPPPSEQW
jgi:hypothetical protein